MFSDNLIILYSFSSYLFQCFTITNMINNYAHLSLQHYFHWYIERIIICLKSWGKMLIIVLIDWYRIITGDATRHAFVICFPLWVKTPWSGQAVCCQFGILGQEQSSMFVTQHPQVDNKNFWIGSTQKWFHVTCS